MGPVKYQFAPNEVGNLQRHVEFLASIPVAGLARRTRRHVLAATAGLAAGDVHAAPGPVAAATVATENVHFHCVGLHRTGDTLNGQVRDGNTIGGSAGRRTILIILFNHNAVVGDTRERNVGESHFADGASSIVNSLDADSIGGIGHGRIGDCHVLHGIVIATTDGTDRKAVPTRAGSSSEIDVL